MVRIRKRTLIYVCGLSTELASAKLLCNRAYFGQYGTVHCVELNSPHERTARPDATPRAYVTYATELEALVAIFALNGSRVAGQELRVSFGLTKYCTYFLRGELCPAPHCRYIHAKARKSDTFFRDDLGDYRMFNPERLQRVTAEIVAEHAEEFARLDEDEGGKSVFPSKAQGVRALRAAFAQTQQNAVQRLRRGGKAPAEQAQITGWEEVEDLTPVVPQSSAPDSSPASTAEPSPAPAAALDPPSPALTQDSPPPAAEQCCPPSEPVQISETAQLPEATEDTPPNPDFSPAFVAQICEELHRAERLRRHPLPPIDRGRVVQGFIDQLILARIERSADALHGKKGSRVLSPAHAAVPPRYPRWEPELDSLLRRFLLLEGPSPGPAADPFRLFGQSYSLFPD